MALLFSAPAPSQPFTILAALHTGIFLGSSGQVDLFPLCYFCNVYLSSIVVWPYMPVVATFFYFAKSLTIPLSASYLDCRRLLVSFKMMARLCFLFYLLCRIVLRILQEYRNIFTHPSWNEKFTAISSRIPTDFPYINCSLTALDTMKILLLRLEFLFLWISCFSWLLFSYSFLPYLSVLMVPVSSIVPLQHRYNSSFYNYYSSVFPLVITLMITFSFNPTAVLYSYLLIGHFNLHVLSIFIKVK